ncbi:MAG TPA: hypothetical protein VK348_05095 [Planctomycetota bacterium]|nr:hypothetical protein [Planctomycetota bacterium]
MRTASPSLRASSWLAVAACASCSTFTRDPDWYRPAEAPASNWAAGELAVMDQEAIWGVGDEVCYEIVIDSGDQHRRLWFTLTNTAIEPPVRAESALPDPISGMVRTYSAHMHFESRDEQGQPLSLLVSYDGRARLHARLADERGRACEATFSAPTMAHLAQQDVGQACYEGVGDIIGILCKIDCFLDELLLVARRPSLASILVRFGRVAVELRWPQAAAETVEQDTPFGRLPTLWVPATFDANGEPALDGRVQFTWRRSPLLLACGVLQIELWRPDDPRQRVTIRLVGARRGVPPDDLHGELCHGLRIGMSLAAVLAATGAQPASEQCGRLADGRMVARRVLRTPGGARFDCVFADDCLLYAFIGPVVDYWLRLRGFVADHEQ